MAHPVDAESWNERYEELKNYKAENGHCRVPARSVLGNWVSRQRGFARKGSLPEDRTRRLEAIGFDWDPNKHNLELWNKRFEELKKYKAEHGDCRVPRGRGLGKWVSKQRDLARKGLLLEDRARRLEAIEFKKVLNNYSELWDKRFEELKEYKAKHGDYRVPKIRSYPATCRLAKWVIKQRGLFKRGSLLEDRAERLEAIGFDWNGEASNKSDDHSDTKDNLEGSSRTEHSEQASELGGLDKAGSEKKAAWNSQPPCRKRTTGQLDGPSLESPGNSDDNRKRSCGTSFEREVDFNGRPLHHVRKNVASYLELSTDDSIPSHSDNEEGGDEEGGNAHGDHVKMGISHPSSSAECVSLNMNLLNSTGFEARLGQNDKIEGPTVLQAGSQERQKVYCSSQFTMQGDILRSTQARAWYKRYGELKEYIAEHGDCNVPRHYAKREGLGTWVNRQRDSYKNGSLLDYRIKRLEQIGFTWKYVSWKERFKQLVKFRRKHGHCNVPRDTMLGKWVAVQRALCQPHLEELGFEWDGREPTHKSKASADTILSENERVCSNEERDGAHISDAEVSHSISSFECDGVFGGNVNKRNGDVQIDNQKDDVTLAAASHKKNELLSVRTVGAEEKVLQLEIKNFLLEEQLLAAKSTHKEETDLITAKLKERHRREMEHQQFEMNECHGKEMKQQQSEMIESHRHDMEQLQSAHSNQIKMLMKELEKARKNQISDIDAGRVPPKEVLRQFLDEHGEAGGKSRDSLLAAIFKTEESLNAIHDWNRSQGLRKCHSWTVVKTQGSRAWLKAFLTGREPPPEMAGKKRGRGWRRSESSSGSEGIGYDSSHRAPG